MEVLVHPEAESELEGLPPDERVAVRHAFEKLEVEGDRLRFPHSSAVQGAGMKLSQLKGHKQILEKDLKNPEFRKKWEQTALARAVALRLVSYRADNELSQTDLADKLGMKQPAIARLERGEKNPTWETLTRLSESLDVEFIVDIAPRGKASMTKGQERSASQVQRVDTRDATIVVAVS